MEYTIEGVTTQQYRASAMISTLLGEIKNKHDFDVFNSFFRNLSFECFL